MTPRLRPWTRVSVFLRAVGVSDDIANIPRETLLDRGQKRRHPVSEEEERDADARPASGQLLLHLHTRPQTPRIRRVTTRRITDMAAHTHTHILKMFCMLVCVLRLCLVKAGCPDGPDVTYLGNHL